MTRSNVFLVVFALLLNVAALTYMAADLEDARTRIAQLEEDLYDEPLAEEPVSFVEASR